LADNRLRALQSVSIANLITGDTYEFKAISISADYGKAMSQPITFLAR
jgi:hypothetical protein